MDNLTHSLVGALIGQAGLKRRTGLAMPALIIGANIPDIDAGCVVYGMESLAMRRGLTHGPIAMVLLPLVLAAALWCFDRWQERRGKRPEGRLPVHFGWLYGLSLLSCLSHPALDWLNNYGVRLLEPFSHRWFYGDTLFIIDVWLWLGMGLAIWLSLRRERRGGEWRVPARLTLGLAALYIAVNLGITYWKESMTGMTEPYPRIAIGNATPVTFWRREMISGNGDGLWRVGERDLGDLPLADCDLATARSRDPRVEAFLFWSRTPLVEQMPDGRWRLRDARFAAREIDRFSVELPANACRLADEGG
jgi:inner membrane protein